MLFISPLPIAEFNSACRSSLKVQNRLNKKLWSKYKFGHLTDLIQCVRLAAGRRTQAGDATD